ncbi:amino acid adenylation domain-containing protein [Nonomuraea sp. NPDC049725]|uniref:amino acid adenylation domain-containing protein n=1 Tax=Nonomuraea sp. NPDC049725 TaxID=3154508 RepID=UPI0034490679
MTRPVSHAQRRLWFLDQLTPGNTAYHIHECAWLGPELDVPALESALRLLVERHEALRTRFSTADGEPRQVIVPAGQAEPELSIAGGDAEAALDGWLRRPIDLRTDLPIRALLAKAADGWLFCLTLHHIAVDGWSVGIVRRELGELYAAASAGRDPALPAPAMTYAEYADGQREWLSGPALDAELDYWTRRLDAAPEMLALPLDRPRPVTQSFRGDQVEVSLDSLMEPLRELGAAHGATPFMVLLASFKVLLREYTGQQDVVVGVPVAGRSRPELAGTVGFLANTLAMRTTFAGLSSFADLLAEVRDHSLDALGHQDLPFELLVARLAPARVLSHNPLVQVLFSVQNAEVEPLRLPGVRVSPREVHNATSKFDLALHIVEDEAGPRAVLEYDTALFDEATVRRMAGHYRRLCEIFAGAPGTRLDALELATPGETREILAAADGAPGEEGPAVPESFARWAAATPDAPAVVCGDLTLTYAEVDREADDLAARLRSAGIPADTPVAVLLGRGARLVPALMGVLKAGLPYLPVDPAYPAERVAHMLRHSGTPLVITDSGLAGTLPEGMPALLVDRPVPPAAEPPPAPPVDPENLAYVIYTSGSTGRPKGVMIPHRALSNLIADFRRELAAGPDLRLLAVTTASFDIAALELFVPLTSGGTVILATGEECTDPEALARRIASARANVMQATPATWRMLAGQDLPRLRAALAGGERLPEDVAERLTSTAERALNVYGPTETTIWSSRWPIQQGPPLIGVPVAGTRLLVLSPAMLPRPVGVPGELYIGGVGVARGYLGSPGMTAERFVPDPLGPPGSVLYRTGDLVRLLPGGDFEYLERVDDQVKVRGFRVELGEVEAALRQEPGVEDAAVVVSADGQSLLAYVVGGDAPAETGAGEGADIVSRWGAVWDDAYGTFAGDGPDYSGWLSSYTGERYSDDDMAEWVSGAVSAIKVLEPRRVLEIGCGTGLLYRGLAGSLDRYVGTDVSETAVARLSTAHAADPAAEFRVGEAADVEAGERFDVVVLNSVIQYFPDAGYLTRVLDRCRGFAPAIFIGDVRSLPLLDAFHHSLPGPAALHAAREDELVVHPDFFVRFAAAYGLVADIRLKPGSRSTEMNLFRYDVTLRPATGDVTSIGALKRIPWRNGMPELPGTADPVLLADIPHPGLTALVGAVSPGEEAEPGPAPWELAAALPGRAVVCLPSARHPGRYHAVVGAGRLSCVAAVDSGESGPLTNQPALREHQRRAAVSLRDRLRDRLPEYMVPAGVTFLSELPRTSNGKLDRAELAASATSTPTGVRRYVAPRTPAERTIASLMGTLLGAGRVGAEDDFFLLGGHSLLATQLLSRVRRAFGTDISLHEFFAAPTVTALAAAVEARPGRPGGVGPAPGLADRSTPIPVSHAQRRLWFLERLGVGGPAYLMYATVRITGDVDVEALRRALRLLVERHETLRTSFGDADGEPVQIVHPPEGDRDVLVVSEDGFAEQVLRPFDLTAAPLLRGVLTRAPGGWSFALVTHHIAADGWSVSILLRELSEAYRAYSACGDPALAPLPVGYSDYVLWQRERLTGERFERSLAHWEKHLAGAPALLALPLDRPRPAVQSFRGGQVEFVISPEVTARLTELGRSRGATLFMVLLAACNALLARISGQHDVVVGTGVAGRQEAELERLVGFFAGTLAIRTDVSGDPSFAELLDRVRDSALKAYEHQDVPFDLLVERLAPQRELSHNPIFQVMFALQNVPREELFIGEEAGDLVPVESGASKFDLGFNLAEVGGGLEGGIEYDSALFDRETAQAFARWYARMLEAVAAGADRPVSALPMLAAQDVERAVRLGAGPVVEVDERCVHELVAEQAAARPDALAVRSDQEELTYGELDRRADRLAGRLRALGVASDRPVPVYLPRSPALIVALLGVLKAGAAYLPVDPAYPAQRIGHMLAEAGSPVVITSSGLAASLPAGTGRPLLMDGEDWSRGPDEAPPARTAPGNLAYVVYTSGSTGTPKGAMITHGGLRNLCQWQHRHFGHDRRDRVTLLASVSFDGLAWEIWPHLTEGASLHVVDDATRANPDALIGFFVRHRITRAFLPTALAQLMAEQDWPADCDLRVVFSGGDRLHWPARERPWRLTNHYGPTETTIVMTAASAEPGPDRREAPPIGPPIDNIRTHVLDAEMRPQPVGVAGELYIGGAGVGRGYFRNAGLTAERWVPDPFGPPGSVLYRSGDLVRQLPDGNLDFLARMDNQVKVRGYRVELGEIEATLRDHPRVRDAVVVTRPEIGGGLAAYLVGDLTTADLGGARRWLRERLPDYMVPGHLSILAAMPLTANGKIDRRALPEIRPAEVRLPQDPVARRVAAVWAEVIGVADVGMNDNFFEVGGNSLLVTRLARGLEAEFGTPVDLVEIFASPTVAAQAEFLATPAEEETAEEETVEEETVEAGTRRLEARARRARRGASR